MLFAVAISTLAHTFVLTLLFLTPNAVEDLTFLRLTNLTLYYNFSYNLFYVNVLKHYSN